MFNTRCGCLTCGGKTIPMTHWGWKALKNKHGHLLGSHPKPKKAKKST